MIDNLDLNLAIACFNSNSLEKKMHALQIICKKIESIQRNARTYNANNNGVKLWIADNDNFQTFLENNKIFDRIFDKSTHQSIVNIAHPLLNFMYNKNMIDRERLDKIFDLINSNVHEAFSTQIYSLIGTLSQNLTYSDLEHTFNKITSQQNFKSINVEILNIIKAMSENSNIV